MENKAGNAGSSEALKKHKTGKPYVYFNFSCKFMIIKGLCDFDSLNFCDDVAVQALKVAWRSKAGNIRPRDKDAQKSVGAMQHDPDTLKKTSSVGKHPQ
jgi:hypothetical protein